MPRRSKQILGKLTKLIAHRFLNWRTVIFLKGIVKAKVNNSRKRIPEKRWGRKRKIDRARKKRMRMGSENEHDVAERCLRVTILIYPKVTKIAT